MILLVCLAVSACSLSTGPAANTQRDTITVGRFERSYEVYVPRSYDGKRAVPLVLAFHGLGGTAGEMRLVTALNTRAESEQFIVVYPEAHPAANRGWAMNCTRCTPADTLGINDVEFTATIIAAVRRQYQVDASRIYATGFSMGGWFTYVLACERPDLVAAIAPVGALIARPVANSCHPTKPVGMAMFFGTADPTQAWEGRAGEYGLLGADSTATLWASLSGCGGQPTRTSLTGAWSSVTRSEWGGCRDAVLVRQYRFENLGHSWPGGVTDEVLAVFARHQRQ
jgi:polyhydroxybutyrate depolymerase